MKAFFFPLRQTHFLFMKVSILCQELNSFVESFSITICSKFCVDLFNVWPIHIKTEISHSIVITSFTSSIDNETSGFSFNNGSNCIHRFNVTNVLVLSMVSTHVGILIKQ